MYFSLFRDFFALERLSGLSAILLRAFFALDDLVMRKYEGTLFVLGVAGFCSAGATSLQSRLMRVESSGILFTLSLLKSVFKS